MSGVRRVVSLVPSMTETVCALGAAERLVGITRYCCEPAAALASVPQVGGTKNPSRDKIAALVPDLVIVNGEENRSEDIDWLAAHFPVLQHQPRSVPQAAAAVRDLAIRLDRREAVQPILLRIEAQIAAAEVAGLQRGRRRIFYAIWKKPWMGANADTYIHDVLTRAGGENVCAGAPDRYPRVDLAELRDRGVDAVLLPTEPYVFTDNDRAELIASGAFGAGVQVLLCDGRDFCWHGAHTAEGLGNAVRLLQGLRAVR
jgi:ABC-type Fe3+-hydroxamate transport system substrate-binding protein